MDNFPLPSAGLDGQRIGPAQQGNIGDAFQRTGIEIDHQRIAKIEAGNRPGIEVCCEHADPGAAIEGGQQVKAICRGAAIDRNLARPWLGMARDQGVVGRLVLAQLRQIQKDHIGSAKHGRRRQGCGTRVAGRQIVNRAVLTHGVYAAQIRIGNRDQAHFRQAAVMIEQDHVARI